MPTVAELSALDYGNENQEGFRSGDYAPNYLQHGKSFDWWKAYPNNDKVINALGPSGELADREGLIYVKQTPYDIHLDLTQMHAMLYNTTEDFFDAEFGRMEKGSSGFSVVPFNDANGVVQGVLGRYDLICVRDFVSIGREVVQRDATSSVKFNRSTVSLITKVLLLRSGTNAVPVPTDEYTLSGNSINWVGSATVSVNDYCSVEYQYAPVWQWIEQGYRGVVQKGVNNNFLPQRGLLVQPQGRDWKNGF